MSSLDEEPSAPRDDPHAYGYPSPRAYVDAEACDRQSAYAAQEPQRREEALNRWRALFGVRRNKEVT